MSLPAWTETVARKIDDPTMSVYDKNWMLKRAMEGLPLILAAQGRNNNEMLEALIYGTAMTQINDTPSTTQTTT